LNRGFERARIAQTAEIIDVFATNRARDANFGRKNAAWAVARVAIARAFWQEVARSESTGEQYAKNK
jgi:hypothetical protein